MKILFMIPSLGQGGAEKVLVNLVNNLNPTKFDITIQTLFDEGENKQFLKPYIHYRSYLKHQFRGNKEYFKLYSPKQLYKKIVKGTYDIVVSYLEGPTARIVSGCDNPQTKLVSWIHCEQHNKNNASSSFRNYKEALLCYSKFDKIICVSKSIKKDFLNVFPINNSVSILYNVNENEQIQNFGKESIDLVFNPNTINICAIGTLKEVKGFDRLIRIIKRLINEQIKVNLYILGKGPLEKKLKAMTQNFCIENNVIFLGYQTNPYKFLSKMDIYVCSSYSEGFSTATTEALILGIPVVTVMVPGMEEMLGYNNEFGIITENNEDSLFNALKDLIINKDKLYNYSLKAKQRGVFFSKSYAVEEVEKMFYMLDENEVKCENKICY